MTYMNEDHDDNFDDADDDLGPLLKKHLAAALDPQLAKLRPPHVAVSRSRWRIGLASVGALAAAAVVGLAMLPRTIVPTQTTDLQYASTAPATTNASPDDAPGSLEQVVWSRTIDAGTVYLDDATPA